MLSTTMVTDIVGPDVWELFENITMVWISSTHRVQQGNKNFITLNASTYLSIKITKIHTPMNI